jgi:hypothetical protein
MTYFDRKDQSTCYQRQRHDLEYFIQEKINSLSADCTSFVCVEYFHDRGIEFSVSNSNGLPESTADDWMTYPVDSGASVSEVLAEFDAEFCN